MEKSGPPNGIGRRRSAAIIVRQISREERRIGEMLYPYPLDVERPQTRSDCSAVPRPCPFVSCRHHLYLDVVETGTIVLNFPDLEPWEIPYSCSLDEAEDGSRVLEDVGLRMNLTRERVRQIERTAVAKTSASALPDVNDFESSEEAEEPDVDDD